MKLDVFPSSLLKVGEANPDLTGPLCLLVGGWEMSSESRDSKNSQKQVWWPRPIIPALGRPGKQVALSLKVNLAPV